MLLEGYNLLVFIYNYDGDISKGGYCIYVVVIGGRCILIDFY